MADVENVEPAEEILEMSTEKLDEISEKKKKNSLLSEVLVTGLLKNINEKVNNKLDNDAQSELVDIINEKVKDGYEGGLIDLESEVEKAISFDDCPTNDHLIGSATKNRVTLPTNRRLPTKESKLYLCETQELNDYEETALDIVDKDFENLFQKGDVCDLDETIESEENKSANGNSGSFDADFDALLNKNTALIEMENDMMQDVEADFDALLIEENLDIELTNTLKEKNDNDEKATYVKLSKNELNDISNDFLLQSESLKIQTKYDEHDGNVTDMAERNINSSIMDVFDKREKEDENSLQEVQMLVENELLDENNSSSKAHSKLNDPFDDLFNELDEDNLDEVDKGFQKIYAIGKKNEEDEKQMDIFNENEPADDISQELEVQFATDVDQQNTQEIANHKIGTVAREENLDIEITNKLIENNVNVDEAYNVKLDKKLEKSCDDVLLQSESQKVKTTHEEQPDGGVKDTNESDMNNSMDNIFEKIEKDENSLLEIQTLLDNELIDESGVCKNSEEDDNVNTRKVQSKESDPFDDLFNELDKDTLDDVDKGFEKMFAKENKNEEEDVKQIDIPSENESVDHILESQELEDQFDTENYINVDHRNYRNTKATVNQENKKGAMDNIEESSQVQEINIVSMKQIKETLKEQCKLNKTGEQKKYEQEIERMQNEIIIDRVMFKKKVDELENEKANLKAEVKVLMQKQNVLEINESGKKVIIPTEIHDPEKLHEEIMNDTREAELLIQLKHLSERVEAQDTLLAETKEDNTVLRIQNQSLLEAINKSNSGNSKMRRKRSIDTPSLDWLDGEDSNEKKRLFLLEQELEDQKEVNKQLKAYVGDILINIIVQNPQILEKKQ